MSGTRESNDFETQSAQTKLTPLAPEFVLPFRSAPSKSAHKIVKYPDYTDFPLRKKQKWWTEVQYRFAAAAAQDKSVHDLLLTVKTPHEMLQSLHMLLRSLEQGMQAYREVLMVLSHSTDEDHLEIRRHATSELDILLKRFSYYAPLVKQLEKENNSGRYNPFVPKPALDEPSRDGSAWKAGSDCCSAVAGGTTGETSDVDTLSCAGCSVTEGSCRLSCDSLPEIWSDDVDIALQEDPDFNFYWGSSPDKSMKGKEKA